MICSFDLYVYRDGYDAEYETPTHLSDESLDGCAWKANQLVGSIAGYPEQSAALFFVLCRDFQCEDFGVAVVARVCGKNGVRISADEMRELGFLAEEIMYSAKEFDDVCRWFQTRFDRKRRAHR
jgi:hypothetical protein